MSIHGPYAHGTPNWVDLQTTDQNAAKAFYAGLFGWEYEDVPMAEGGPVYSMARLGGNDVAAIAAQSPDLAAAGAPPMWNTYIAVDSVDAAVAKVNESGGQILMQPFDVMEAGRMAVVTDPSGAAVCLWEAKDHQGAALVNEPGALTWNELITGDPAAIGFYERLLGLKPSAMDYGGMPYTTFDVDGEMIAGSMAPPMEGIPSHWHVYFATGDADATAERAKSLGGSVMQAPFDTPAGRIAVLADPQGAVFSVIKTAPMS